MSYCLIRNIMVAYVKDSQLVCSKIKLKLGGPDSTALYNFDRRIHHDICGRILLEDEQDRDVLPTLRYRNSADVVPGQGGILKRIEQFGKDQGINCRVVDCFKDAVQPVAYAFFVMQQTVACQILETDKEDLRGKTVLIGADSDVDYAGRNVVPLVCGDNYEVDDTLLGVNMYSLYDDSYKMMVMIEK